VQATMTDVILAEMVHTKMDQDLPADRIARKRKFKNWMTKQRTQMGYHNSTSGGYVGNWVINPPK